MNVFGKILAVVSAAVLLAAGTAVTAAAATVKVYDKDIALADDEGSKTGWKLIADDPGFYFTGDRVPVHKSPSLWKATDQADKAFSWKTDKNDRTEGVSSLSQTYSTGFFFYWLTEYSGKTLDLTNIRYLMMDLYVEDTEIFLNASDFRISFTDSTDKNNLNWDHSNVSVSRDTLKGQFLRKGWNSLRLYVGNTDDSANINLKAVTGLRFFAVDLSSGTHTIKIDNVHLVSKKYTTQQAGTTVQTKAPQTTAAARPDQTTAPVKPAASESAAPVQTTAATAPAASETAAQSELSAEQPETRVSEATTAAVTPADASGTDASGTDSRGALPAWVWVVIGVAVLGGAAAAAVIVLRQKK